MYETTPMNWIYKKQNEDLNGITRVLNYYDYYVQCSTHFDIDVERQASKKYMNIFAIFIR